MYRPVPQRLFWHFMTACSTGWSCSSISHSIDSHLCNAVCVSLFYRCYNGNCASKITNFSWEFLGECIRIQLKSISYKQKQREKLSAALIFELFTSRQIYKPSYVPDVSLRIRTVEILQDYCFKANFIKIFARWLIIFKPLTLNTYIFEATSQIYFISKAVNYKKKERIRSLQLGVLTMTNKK